LLIRREKRADIFHRTFETPFDVHRDSLQLLVLLFEPNQTPGELVGTLLLTAQAFVDQRLESGQCGVYPTQLAIGLRLVHAAG
ncbi:MAG TPA: hypothetical protein VK634_03140, partial [Reyranella sp.]|nr:hypothetical protein [Reyranella sp.]